MEFTLTSSSPSFTAPADEARRSAFAMAVESLLRGARAALGAAAGFPALLAVALCVGAGLPGKTRAALLLAAAAAGFAAGRFAAAPPWLIWAGALAASVAAIRRGLARPAEAAAAACLGLAWHAAAAPLLPRSGLALPFALAGALGAGAALLAAAWLGVRAEYRHLVQVSESRVEELFARRSRLASTALMMISAYGLWQSFKR